MKCTRKLVSLLLMLALLAVTMASTMTFTSAADTLDTSMTLHQVGNQLFNEKGQAVRLLGVNIPQFGWSLTGENRTSQLIDMAIDDWQCNFIRLAVKPAYWLGLGNTSAAEAKAYRDRVDDAVAKIAAAGKYVLLDNHCFYLPGDDSEKFWADAAVHYKDHPNVIFGLFNEPANCSWSQYFEGAVDFTYNGENEWGQTDSIHINSKGVPNLLKIVRATGAKNVVTLSGLTWGFNLQYMTHENFLEFAEGRAQVMIDDGKLTESGKAAWIKDYVEKYEIRETTGNGIMFETHPYPEREDEWDDYLFDTLMQYPVVVGECGPTENRTSPIRVLSANDKSYLDKLTAYMDKYGMNLTAWSVGAWPYLTQSVNITKPSAYGEVIRDFIIANDNTKSVQLFDAAEFEGKFVALFPGKYNLADLGGFDMKKLGSVSCKEDYYQYVVTFYEKANQSGKSYAIIPDASNLSVKEIGFTPASLLIERKIRENILPGHATVTANGAVGDHVAALTVDGKTSTYWQNQSDTYSELVVKLDKVYALNGITLCHAAEAGMLSSDNSRSYTVSLSTNGQVYTRVVDVAGNGLGRTSYYFDQTPASYIRVQIRKGGIIEPDVAYLAELMAYGSVYNGTVVALPGQIADLTDEVQSDVSTPDDVVEPDVDIDVTPDVDVDADPDKEVEIDTSDDVPDRTYFMDSEGNIYYIDDNGDKVLVDEDGKEIGRVPAKTKPQHANASPVVWPYIVGGVVLVAAIGGVATLLVVRTKKAKSKPQE